MLDFVRQSSRCGRLRKSCDLTAPDKDIQITVWSRPSELRRVGQPIGADESREQYLLEWMNLHFPPCGIELRSFLVIRSATRLVVQKTANNLLLGPSTSSVATRGTRVFLVLRKSVHQRSLQSVRQCPDFEQYGSMNHFPLMQSFDYVFSEPSVRPLGSRLRTCRTIYLSLSAWMDPMYLHPLLARRLSL